MSRFTDRRRQTVGIVAGALAAVLVMGPVAAALLPVASLDPKSGLAGSEITITVSQYSPDIPIEVRETDGNGALIGMGATGPAGTGSFPITIPETASGSYLLYICGLCTSQYPEWATRSFFVTGPAPSTTTTLATTTTTIATTTTVTSTTSTATTTPTVSTAVPTGVEGGGNDSATAPATEESSSRGLLIGAIIVLAVILAVIVGVLIGSSTSSKQQPPLPPPPAP